MTAPRPGPAADSGGSSAESFAAATRVRERVLVIDDETNIRSTLAEFMALSGYDVDTAQDGRHGMDLLGSREYDLNRIGFKTDRFRGGFRYDTSVEGNSNDGHLFQEGGPGNGIIGPLLTPDDRLAIIEFLKTLCSELKRACGCGGSTTDDGVELQGDLRDRVRTHLISKGFLVKG